MIQESECFGILLAAGKGQRFDASGQQNKLLALLPSGITVAQSSANNLRTALQNSIVILPSENVKHENAQLNQENLSTIFQDQACQVYRLPAHLPDNEMAASLVFGLQQLPQHCAYFIIALADMPYVKPESIKAIANALKNGADIAVPVHDGKRGNPVGFSRRYLPELLTLSGDQGARSIMKKYPVKEVVLNDAGIFQDIDEPKDILGYEDCS
jgi:molybdenum cofactor cytidylyltransferase